MTVITTDLQQNIPFSTRSLNHSLVFPRLNRSFLSPNNSSNVNATNGSRFSFSANLNLNQFPQTVLDSVAPPMLHVESNFTL